MDAYQRSGCDVEWMEGQDERVEPTNWTVRRRAVQIGAIRSNRTGNVGDKGQAAGLDQLFQAADYSNRNTVPRWIPTYNDRRSTRFLT